MNKAVFIDKEGTLIKDIPFNVKAELIEFEEGAFESLLQLQQKGYRLIIITNQPGVALGHFKEEELKNLGDNITELLLQKEVKLDGFYYCPHAEHDNCECRKPKPGLILTAARNHEIDLTESWMLGGILNDVEAGNRSSCRSILIDRGNETEWVWSDYRKPNFIVRDLKSAAEMILLQTI